MNTVSGSYARLSTLRPDVSGATEQIVVRCLRFDPKERFASAGDMADAMRSARAPLGTPPRP